MLLGDQLCVASMSFANHLQGWIPKSVPAIGLYAAVSLIPS